MTANRYGLKLMSELHGARALVRQAEIARDAGFDYVAISDHIHPWLPEHDHSPFAWSVLGGIAARVPDLPLATGVTCPIGRYHPVIVAHAAATVASMSDRPFTLALGAGERLNEHVTGEPFPAVDLRHERLAEAIEIIRELWDGRWTNVRGRFFTAEDVRLYDLPREPIRIVVAVSGPASLDLARGVGADGIMATEADPDLTAGWARRGGNASSTWTEIPFAWAPTAEEGLDRAHRLFRFGAAGWKVMSELPNPVNFDAACRTVRPEDLADTIPHGPDPQVFADAVRRSVDAGFTEIAVVPLCDDVEAFGAFWQRDVRPLLD